MSAVPPAPQAPNGLGTAALVLGIVAIAGAAIPFLNFVSLFVASVGLILGILGLVLVKNKTRGRALAGTIISAVAIVVAISVLVVTAAVIAVL